MPARAQHQSAYILHTRPYSETSLLVDAFSRNYGRISLLAKGARRVKSRVRGLIRPFQRLLLSWSGKGELQTLTAAEADSALKVLERQSWLSGCYMNELLVNLIHKHDPHEQLFDHYDETLESLHNGAPEEVALRIFEKHLLREIGYGLVLTHDIDNKKPLKPGLSYHYYPERGPVQSVNKETGSVWQINGSTLLALDKEFLANHQEIVQSKRLLRALLNQSLQGKVLKTRLVFQGIKSIR